ncbi:MAG: hypothetical protein LAO78_11185 [Acidobacteriia bacterium]|nr:hypothetical protein [Terriglobia bacterium]
MSEQRNARLLGSLRWWHPDRPVASAQEWLLKNSQEAGRIRPNQWEALRRMGENAATPGEYKQAIRVGLSREIEEGVFEPRWPKALLDALLDEITAVAQPDAGEVRRELELQLAKLPAQAQSLRDQIAVEQAQAFVDALVTRIQAERALEGKEP